MKEYRVLLAVDSPMFREMLHRLLDREQDFRLVGEVADPVDLLLTVRRTRADVVIHTWPRCREMPGICSHLLHEYPELLVIAIPVDSDRFMTCRQTITVSEFPDGGIDNVFSEIRRTRVSSETAYV